MSTAGMAAFCEKTCPEVFVNPELVVAMAKCDGYRRRSLGNAGALREERGRVAQRKSTTLTS